MNDTTLLSTVPTMQVLIEVATQWHNNLELSTHKYYKQSFTSFIVAPLYTVK